MKAHFPWFGVALIVAGAVMVLHRMGYLAAEWPLVFWFLLALYGAVRLWRGYSAKEPGAGVFWGTVFLGLGTYEVLEYLGVIWVPGYIAFPGLVMLVGVAFFLLYLTRMRNWHLLVPAIAFFTVGGLMLLSELDYIDHWVALSLLQTYWPIVLILFGASLLLNRTRMQ